MTALPEAAANDMAPVSIDRIDYGAVSEYSQRALVAMAELEVPAETAELHPEVQAELGYMAIRQSQAIRIQVYSNGARHVNRFDQAGNRRHISYDSILEAYGYQPKSAEYRQGLAANRALKKAVSTELEEPASEEIERPIQVMREYLAQRERQAGLGGAVSRQPSGPRAKLRHISHSIQRSELYKYHKLDTAVALLATGAVAATVVLLLNPRQTSGSDAEMAPLQGYNSDGTVNCQTIEHEEFYGECLPDLQKKQEAALKAQEAGIAKQGAAGPELTVAPKNSHEAIRPTDIIVPSGITIRSPDHGQADGLWKGVTRSITINGTHLTPPEISQVVTQVEHEHGITSEQQAEQTVHPGDKFTFSKKVRKMVAGFAKKLHRHA